VTKARPERSARGRRAARRALAAGHRVWRHPRGQALVAAAVLAAVAAFYLQGLTAWLVNDDEGSYLYAAWRISLGELPYRDFLTPQLPAFLIPGGALMRAFGPDAWPARAAAVVAVLAAGAAWWAVARRLLGPGVALVGALAFLLHPDVYAACRTFRPEPFMLLWQALGTLAFARAVLPRPDRSEPPRRGWLAVAGALFGLATLTKLFGPWPLAGLLLWLLDDGRRRARPWRRVAADALVALSACGVVVGVGMAALALAAGPRVVWDATVGHHVRQGASKPLGQVLGQGVALFALYLRDANRAVPAVLAVAVGAHVLVYGSRAERLMAWPLVTALGFLVLTRDRYPRHLLYLAPHVGLLFALAAQRIGAAGARTAADARWARLAAAALVVAVLSSWRLYDRDYYQARREDGTGRVGDLLALATAPDATVFSDYSELNFYARRPTSYSAASLSSGAVQSGQIDWPRLRAELDGAGRPALLLLELDSPYSHLRYLSAADRAAFEAWRDAGYGLSGTLVRTPEQRFAVYARRDLPLPELARFDGGPTLLAAGPDRANVAAGGAVDVRAAWRAPDLLEGRLGMTARLVDGEGRMVAQADAGLLAAGGRDVAGWAAGELSALRVRLVVPEGTPPGAYAVRLGVYRRLDEGASSGADGVVTLPATDAAGAGLGSSIVVGSVAVSAWRPSPLADPTRTLGLLRPPRPLRSPAGGLALVGFSELPAESVTAGDVLPIALAWRVAEAPKAVTARLTLVEPGSGAVAADRRVDLGSADAAASAWPAGAVVRRVVPLPLRADAAGGRYGLVLALEDADGNALSAPDVPLGTVRVAARDLSDRILDPALLPELTTTAGVVLGDVGTLVGARIQRAGDVLTATLVWQATAPSDVPLHVTVQLLGPDGRPVAQHDGPPAGGARPTTGWLPGEYILDVHTLTVQTPPRGQPALGYALVAALYDPSTGTRLPATDPAGDGLVPLGDVRVRVD